MQKFFIFPLLYILNTIIIRIPTINAFSNPTLIGNETDRLALVDFKSKITHDPHGVLSSWNESTDHCLWEGVTCNRRHKRVWRLRLVDKGLVGTLSPSVGNLSFLHGLILVNNTFSGRIPPQVGRLFRLQFLALYDSGFEGEIPANISGCLQLRKLVLSRNKLVGKIPLELSLLSKLVTLALDFNNLTGNNLSPLSNLTSLQELYLAQQIDQGGPGFQGTIPDFIGNFKDLTKLGLAGNSFTGKIPPSLYNLSKIEIFSISSNLLEGSLPPDLGFYFPQLQTFQVLNNQLSGPIPLSLSNLSNLEYLDLSINNFTGKFLFDGRNMPNLSILRLHDANLGRGEADDLNFLNTLVNCSHLTKLSIGSNYFAGVLPHSIVNLSTTIQWLDLHDNFISGSIPLGLGKYINLQYLVLYDNQLSGTIPTDVGDILSLQDALFANNQFSGSIPWSLGNISWLSILDLSLNKLQGTVPINLGNCKNLLQLRLNQNNLSGNIPRQLFQASTMVQLHLDHNHLQGSLPSEIGDIKNLVYLDVSNNNLSGNLPSGIGQCVALTNLYMNANSFVGVIPSSCGFLKDLQEIDLSCNKISGQLPPFFSNFSSLALLNLSYNDFEGKVPTTGVFTNISTVLLVGNSKLCGGIPQLKLPSCPYTKSNVKSKSHALVITAVSISCLLIGLAIVFSIYFFHLRRRKASTSSEVRFKEPFIKVSYDMLLKATNGFSTENLIGSGGFGSVYKGHLLLDGVEKVVAVKVINSQRQGASKSFLAECKALRIIRHRNLVGVITACSSIDFQQRIFKALVYEFMPKGSLERWIYSNPSEGDNGQYQSLSLLQRLNIAIDVAYALDYIHNGNDPPIIHCDLKPTNILLDEDMTAHVGDFGLVKLLPEVTEQLHDSSSIGVRGTVGYAAPEYGLGTSVSAAGDVYSYGIILLEMMTAKNPTNTMFEGDMSLHKFAESALADRVLDIIDPKLTIDDDVDDNNDNDDDERNNNMNGTRGVTEYAFECIRSLIMIGVRCSSELPQDRMNIKDVIHQLVSQRDNLLLCNRRHRCQLIA